MKSKKKATKVKKRPPIKSKFQDMNIFSVDDEKPKPSTAKRPDDVPAYKKYRKKCPMCDKMYWYLNNDKCCTECWKKHIAYKGSTNLPVNQYRINRQLNSGRPGLSNDD